MYVEKNMHYIDNSKRIKSENLNKGSNQNYKDLIKTTLESPK